MIVLAIESSTRMWNVALVEKDRVRGQSPTDRDAPISRDLAPTIRQLLAEAQLDAADLDLVAVTRGPGAFTPLRVGITAAKSLAFALDVPVVAQDSLQLLAIGAAQMDGWPAQAIYSSFIDAQRDEFFFGRYRFDQPWHPIEVEPSGLLSIDELAGRRWDSAHVCVGPPGQPPPKGIPVFRSAGEPTAVTLGQWAIRLAERGEVRSAIEVLPEYGRPSYAEERRRASG